MSADVRRAGRPIAKYVFSNTPPMANAVRRLLADIRELAPGIAARAAEIEDARRIPPDLVETLRSIGVFRMFVPQSHGGLELDLPAALEVIGALGRIDGSVGWTAMIGAGSAIFVPYLPRETFDQVYQNGPDMIIAASAQPAGTAEGVAGRWRTNGRWPFMSGCQHADGILGFCVVTESQTAKTCASTKIRKDRISRIAVASAPANCR